MNVIAIHFERGLPSVIVADRDGMIRIESGGEV